MPKFLRLDLRAVIASSFLVIAAAGKSEAVTALSPDDVCAAAADPCLIEQVVEVSGHTILDFGDRTLRIKGAGQLRFGSGSPVVRSAKLEVTVEPDHPAIVVAASDETEKRNPYLVSGTMDIDGPLELNLRYGEQLMLQVWGDAVLRGAITVTSNDAYIGDLVIRSTGSVSLLGTFQTDEGGGVLDVWAKGDVNAGGEITMVGAREQAGWMLLVADHDISVSSDIRVRSSDFGRIRIYAGRDVHIRAAPDSPTSIDAGILSPGEHGGDIFIYASGELHVDQETSILAPGDFSFVILDGIERIEMHGLVVGGGRGYTNLSLNSHGDIHIGSGARIESVMGHDNRGFVGVYAFGDLEMEGAIAVSGEGDGDYGVYLQACSIALGAHSTIDNSIESSTNLLVANYLLEAEDGARVTSSMGRNLVQVRDAGSFIPHDSLFDPLPEVYLVPELSFCAHCALGQSECDDGIECTADHCEGDTCIGVGADEACDDGRFCNGAETCDIEYGCVAGTPVDCTFLDDQCSTSFCEEESDGCATYPIYAECDDQDPCTFNDQCGALVCRGQRDVACGDCGNSFVDWGEDCDDGDTKSLRGDGCTADCQFVLCGYPVSPQFQWPRILDALYVLKASVGLASCAVRVCDVDGDLQIGSSDALLVLQTAIHIRALPCWS